jgi:integrase/recombinase XerD
VTPQAVDEFLTARRDAGHRRRLSRRGLAPLLGYLRRLEVLPEPASSVVAIPAEVLIGEYRDYLVRERGLAAGSVRLYERVARLFLAERSEPIRLNLHRLSAGEVTAFVLHECRSTRRGVASAKSLITALRSLLRFLHVAGWIPNPLAIAVPGVAGWRMSGLPRALAAEQVGGLLESCDRTTAQGRRDFAILTLLARLGLRTQEVADLQLDDVDWRAGELLIRGKGQRWERLPLPQDVGAVLVDYLRHGRPRCLYRSLFLRARAPRMPLTAAGVRSVVHHACDRAGLARVGAHRLRHTVATQLLQAGAPLSEIAQLLRHVSEATTAVYAKVDRAALQAVARPWPVGAA